MSRPNQDAPVKDGRCAVHGVPVGPIVRRCVVCHLEALAAAGGQYAAHAREKLRDMRPLQ